MFRSLILIAAIVCLPVTGRSQSNPIVLDFLPPTLAPRDVCNATRTIPKQNKLTVGGPNAALTDPDRIKFLRRDIRNYMNGDADGFFDFIEALIAKQVKIDDTFTAVDATFSRIDLMLRAGRIDALTNSGLIAGLRDQVSDMTNGQQVTLARFFTEGTGGVVDLEFSQNLIREAAFGGHAQALLEIARLKRQGELIEDWDAPLDLTVTMAFGGILGALDRGVCGRAERIAQEYINGDIVAANPALALAWYKFAADMGGANAAWRVVEFYLNANSDTKNNIELRRYLKQSVRLGIAVDEVANARLVNSGAFNEAQLAAVLGFNHSQDSRRTTGAIASLLRLDVNADPIEPNEGGLILIYLREVAQWPQAPGRVFDKLAGEILNRKGRWAGEAEAMELLEQAALRGDGLGQRRLAKMLLRYRDDPTQVARAESLLMEVVSRHGISGAMRDLDTLYRCQINQAPLLTQADPWAAAYRATGHGSVSISAADLLALSPNRSPEVIAKIQTQALDRRVQMMAAYAQRVQASPMVSAAALRIWAKQLNSSDQALEAFAKLEFELATTPAQRDLAIELLRRVYLNNGVTSALDLAVALTKYNARDPKIADEIEHLLTMAGNRGEGGAIRLLSRLQANVRPQSEVYAQFADKIEARGDFLALMFAIPHLSPEQVDDYIDRAVSVMYCGTKDADELGDAHALLGDEKLSHHWRQIGLNFEGGHVLSKMRLSNSQMNWFDDGAAPDPVARAIRAMAAGDKTALMRLVGLTADPDLPTYDAKAAVEYFVTGAGRADVRDAAALATVYRTTSDEVRTALDRKIDIEDILKQSAENGDASAAFVLGMRMRDTATSGDDLAGSLDWLEKAAKRGHREAMYQTGFALGFGMRRVADIENAISWLEQAANIGHQDAKALANVLRATKGR